MMMNYDDSVAPDGTSYPLPTSQKLTKSYQKLKQEAERHCASGKEIVVVQGLGFVGMAVAAIVANAKNQAGKPLYFVIGVDLPSPSGYWRVASLNEGHFAIPTPDAQLPKLISRAVNDTKNLRATVSEQVYSLADVIVVDIPLDVANRFVQAPSDIDIDIENFENALRAIGRFMNPDALVLIETTVPIGTAEHIALPILQQERERRGIDTSLLLAHAYERVMPGPHYVNSIRRYWRTFAGIDPSSTLKARNFLSSFIDTEDYPLWELEDPNSSELAKLLENSYRAVNIALIYEWTLLAEQVGVNLFEIIDSIRVRQGTHDNIRTPGFGVGGYCLTKDSLLAQWSSNHLFDGRVNLKMTLDGIRINNQMPLHTFALLQELMEDSLSGKTIAVCGVSYLPGVADTRNSPTEIFVDVLLETGANVLLHDPYVLRWAEKPEIPVYQDLNACLASADGIIFAVAHREYLQLQSKQLLKLVKPLFPVIIDAQNIISDEKAKLLYEAGCRLMGVGKGHWRKRRYHVK